MRSSVLLGLVILVLVGCGSWNEQEKWEAQYCATAYAETGALPATNCATWAAQYYGLSLPIGTATPNPNYTLTLSVMDVGLTQAALIRSDGLTSDAQALQLEREKIAAEERARLSALKAEADAATARAYSAEQTAQAVVAFARQTSDAIGTMQMSTVQAGWTVTSGIVTNSWIGTATAYPMTEAMRPTSDFMTKEANDVAAAIAAAELEKVRLAVDRQRRKNLFDAYGPWSLLILVTAGALAGFIQFTRLRLHARDEHGRKQIATYIAKDGSMVALDMSRVKAAIVKVSRQGEVVQYEGASDDEQMELNKQEHMVDALAALPSTYANLAPQLMSGLNGRGGARVQVSVDTRMGGALDEANRQFIEEAKSD